MRVAALQMVSSPHVTANLKVARQLISEAADAGAELALLPEYFCLLGLKDTDKLAISEQDGGGPLQDFLSQCASDYKLWVVGGTIPLATGTPGKAFNSTLVYDPAGQCVARYDKMHLFQFDDGSQSHDEARVLLPGAQSVTFDMPSVDGQSYRVGLSICYDLRFPELYRQLAADGADLMLVPSAFTHTTGQAHWEILLRARAVENLAYVMAAAQGGTHENKRRTWGHSMVVDPWGLILAGQDQGPGVVLADIDRAKLMTYRSQLPALDHRRL